MKLFNFLVPLVCLVVCTACAKEEIEPENGSVIDTPVETDDPFKDGTNLSIKTRYFLTTLEESIDGYFPIDWSENDCVCVNGFASQRTIVDKKDSTTALMSFMEQLPPPYYVTTPYTTISTLESPKIIFSSTQICTGDKINASVLPMCGYSESTDVTMRHLAGAICINLSKADGIAVINKAAVTSNSKSKLSGEFDVDVQNATMMPSSTASSTITFIYPDGKFLSSDVNASLYIHLPVGTHGECSIIVSDMTGKSMEIIVPSLYIKPGVTVSFETVEFEEGTSKYVKMPGGNKAAGYVRDTNGNPVAGVPVSDGFTIVTTDEEGYYSIEDVSADAWYIYYSTPAGYKVDVNAYGQPCFWKAFEPGVKRYDFTLTPMPGGKEPRFAFFTFGDPQVYSQNNINRFLNEAVPGIYTHAKTISDPVYGMTLGDIVFNTDNYKTTCHMDDMRDGFSVNSVGMPVFQILGNHDQNEYNADNPLEVDARSSDINIKAQREFEEVFGPVDYSYDRSDAHIIGMRNVIFSSPTTSGTGHYHGGFTDRQFEWLKQDLALVPKDKLIIFCVHIPMYSCKDKSIPSLNTHTNISNVLNLLAEYDNVRIMSGHTHTQRNYVHPNGIIEHNSAALSGTWWSSCVCGDGCPSGFNVYKIEGNKVVDSYYYGYTASSSDRNHQMRLYRGNAVTGGPITGTNKNGTMGYYAFNFDSDVLLANVYNASSDWEISVYENGVYSGEMTLVDSSQPALGTLVGSYTYDDPIRAADGIVTGHDFWVTGYLMGVRGQNSGNGAYQECHHMYQYKLKNLEAEIEVRAVDSHGNTYSQTKITEGTDYSAAERP